MCKTLLITMALVSLVSYMGCKDTNGDPISVTPPGDETPLTRDDSVMANCYLVQDALLAYAAVNGGVIPASVNAELLDGRTLVDFLPSGQFLVNPYTGLRTEPFHAMAVHPGETGYVTDGTAFWVNGVGETPAVDLIILVYDPDNNP